MFFENIKITRNYINNLIDNNDLNEVEHKLFTVEDNLLDNKSSVILEYSRLLAHLRDKQEEFDYYKINKFRILINELGYAINNLEEFDIEIIKKIIVYLDLEIDVRVSYLKVFLQMIEHNELNEDYIILKENFNFYYIYKKFSESFVVERG